MGLNITAWFLEHSSYDPVTNVWSSEVASLNSPCSAVCAVETDSYMFALGGPTLTLPAPAVLTATI